MKHRLLGIIQLLCASPDRMHASIRFSHRIAIVFDQFHSSHVKYNVMNAYLSNEYLAHLAMYRRLCVTHFPTTATGSARCDNYSGGGWVLTRCQNYIYSANCWHAWVAVVGKCAACIHLMMKQYTPMPCLKHITQICIALSEKNIASLTICVLSPCIGENGYTGWLSGWARWPHALWTRGCERNLSIATWKDRSAGHP